MGSSRFSYNFNGIIAYRYSYSIANAMAITNWKDPTEVISYPLANEDYLIHT